MDLSVAVMVSFHYQLDTIKIKVKKRVQESCLGYVGLKGIFYN